MQQYGLSTSRVFRLEHNVQNVKLSGLALGEGIGQVFDNAPGAGEGYEDKGRRTAPPLAAWPYTRLPVGDLPPTRSANALRIVVHGLRDARPHYSVLTSSLRQ